MSPHVPYNTLFIGQVRQHLDRVHSTNSYLLECLQDSTPDRSLPEGFLVSAEEQFAGRGQRGNQWHAEAGKNLTLSLLLYPKWLPISAQFRLNVAVALGLWDLLRSSIEKLGGDPIDLRLKWPNDIYYGEKKLGGMLIENGITGRTLAHSVIGIGLNVNQTKGLAALNACSLRMIFGNKVELLPWALMAELSACLEARYLQLKAGKWQALKAAYLSVLYRYEEWADYEDVASSKCFRGRIIDVADQGFLIMETEKGEQKHYAFKEVIFQ